MLKDKKAKKEIDIWKNSCSSNIEKLKTNFKNSHIKINELLLSRLAFNNIPGSYILMLNKKLTLMSCGGIQYSQLNSDLIGKNITELECIFNGYIDRVVNCCINALNGTCESFLYKHKEKSYICNVSIINNNNDMDGIVLISYDVTEAIKSYYSHE